MKLAPVIHGGGHELGIRSGTLNVPAIVGFGMACELCQKEMKQDFEHVKPLRDRLEEGLLQSLDQIHVNGHPIDRLYNNLNISFSYVESDPLLSSLGDRIAISAGSACSSGTVEASHVLKALGIPGERVHSAVRFGLGRFTTQEEVDYVIEEVTATVKKLRSMSGLYEEDQKGFQP